MKNERQSVVESLENIHSSKIEFNESHWSVAKSLEKKNKTADYDQGYSDAVNELLKLNEFEE